jgi:hypothetical protein
MIFPPFFHATQALVSLRSPSESSFTLLHPLLNKIEFNLPRLFLVIGHSLCSQVPMLELRRAEQDRHRSIHRFRVVTTGDDYGGIE